MILILHLEVNLSTKHFQNNSEGFCILQKNHKNLISILQLCWFLVRINVKCHRSILSYSLSYQDSITNLNFVFIVDFTEVFIERRKTVFSSIYFPTPFLPKLRVSMRSAMTGKQLIKRLTFQGRPEYPTETFLSYPSAPSHLCYVRMILHGEIVFLYHCERSVENCFRRSNEGTSRVVRCAVL